MNVDCIGELVKLVLNRNHINQFNTYNQVSSVHVQGFNGNDTDRVCTLMKIQMKTLNF